MGLCRFNINTDCTFEYSGYAENKCIACALDRAEKMHPYAVSGDEPYHYGWTDAIDAIRDMLQIQ